MFCFCKPSLLLYAYAAYMCLFVGASVHRQNFAAGINRLGHPCPARAGRRPFGNAARSTVGSALEISPGILRKHRRNIVGSAAGNTSNTSPKASPEMPLETLPKKIEAAVLKKRHIGPNILYSKKTPHKAQALRGVFFYFTFKLFAAVSG